MDSPSLLDAQPAHILDLGCGPGLYANRLAELGHTCTGIDYSPASIDYARAQAAARGLPCAFHLGDIRHAEYGSGYDLAMLLYGELNVFRPADAHSILRLVHSALAPDGRILLEPHTFAAVHRLGQANTTWQSLSSGLFADWPHLYLQEHFWSDGHRAATIRYFIVNARNGETTGYAQSLQAYDAQEYMALLQACGFDKFEFHAGLCDNPGATQEGLMAIVAFR
ncbi:MAG: class I SAM-dependent methyltransferase [Caldilineaceae bacterium]|nr:class I SAM-dependent methyltransferase [Caldilineaceae bacterium]